MSAASEARVAAGCSAGSELVRKAEAYVLEVEARMAVMHAEWLVRTHRLRLAKDIPSGGNVCANSARFEFSHRRLTTRRCVRCVTTLTTSPRKSR